MKMTLTEIAHAVGAPIADDQAEAFQQTVVTDIMIDSRKGQSHSLFTPLKDRRDGHDFVLQAQAAGAVASFWQKGHPNRPQQLLLLEVDDVLEALQRLAKYYLRKVNPKVVAITGSNGKTTTKDMTAAILATQHNTTKTQANFNNNIGVPLTILGMETNTEVLVVEMGMDHPGQLTFLSKLVEPDVAVITMIGEAHIEFFGTRAKIADAKMEITAGLKEDGLLIINGDEPLLTSRAKDWASQTFGFAHENDLYPTSLSLFKDHSQFKVNQWPELDFMVPLLGEYNVLNAMAAMLVGEQYHVRPQAMVKALADFQPTANRTQWLVGQASEAILSDVYNSNPTAAREVLQNFVKVPVSGHRVVVLGDMLELGNQSAELHAGLADYLDPEDISDVYLYGPQMKALYDRLQNKYTDDHLHYFSLDEQDNLIEQLQQQLHSTDAILLKGSNGMKLSRVLKALL